MPDAPRFCRSAAFDLFRTQLPTLEETRSLVRAAVAISMHDLADVTPEDVERHLDELAAEVTGRVRSRDPRALVARLHEVLFDERGFTGNTENYYDPANSYLPRVLETRRGIPVTLSLVYKSVAQRLGLTARGINSPMHFLSAVAMDGSWMIIDVFQHGRVLTAEEAFGRLDQLAGTPVARSSSLLATATHKQWLARIVRNLEQIYDAAGRSDDAEAMRELLALLKDPD